MTTRKLERGETQAIRNKTKTQLERALDWPDGVVDKILAGTATPSEVTEVVHRVHVTDSAKANDYVDSGVRRVGNLTRQERAEQLQRLGRASAELGGLTATAEGQVTRPQIRKEDEDAIFEYASQLVPLLARRAPSSPASRAAVTSLLDVMSEIANWMLQPGDTVTDEAGNTFER